MSRRRVVLVCLCAVMVLVPTLSLAAQETPSCDAEQGAVVVRQIKSAAIGLTKSYSVYLPPDWCNLEDMPLLVMLHGWSGDNTDWVAQGHLDTNADRLILAGDIRPLVILMPDGDNSFYLPGAAQDYETYVVEELIGAVEDEFSISSARADHFIGGLSMGGFGALFLSLSHPDLFGAVGAHSPALWSRDDPNAPPFIYGPHYEDYAPDALLMRAGWPKDMRLFLDVGGTDSLLVGLAYFVSALWTAPGELAEVDYQVHIWPGAHNWDYWSAHAPDYLRFYAGIDAPH
jgi:enterochelin esterase family protein